MTMDSDAFLEVLRRQRAIRKFTDQPVDDETVEKLLRAAVRAPNGGNSQPWRFIVIRDRDTKEKLGTIFDELAYRVTYVGGGAPENTPWRDVPVLIAVLSEDPPGGGPQGPGMMASNIYPAVQNILLAVTALGLGSVLTTRWKQREDEVKAILGLGAGQTLHAILPIGWPDRQYGRSRRRPIAEVTFREKYGQPWR